MSMRIICHAQMKNLLLSSWLMRCLRVSNMLIQFSINGKTFLMQTTPIKLDDLDKSILKTLMMDARTPYAEMAKLFNVSPATIHVRIEKMRSTEVIERTEVVVNTKKLGYDVCCFIGINLKSARDYHTALDKLNALDEVVEAYYTTGAYNIFVKLMCRSIEELQHVLINKLQAIDEVQSTETLISLQNPINRNVNP